MNLRGMIVSKYGNVTQFCVKTGWHPRKMQRILTGKQELKRSDILELARLLELEDTDMFLRIFFNELSTK